MESLLWFTLRVIKERLPSTLGFFSRGHFPTGNLLILVSFSAGWAENFLDHRVFWSLWSLALSQSLNVYFTISNRESSLHL